MVSDHLRSPDFRSWSKKGYLWTAFAVGHLARINGFHPYPCRVVHPDPPNWSFLRHDQWSRSSACSIIPCCGIRKVFIV